ncbi:imidazole glycerol phosphate synthase subunit HisH [Thermoflexibacter ruber]|uniref:Imidazole glycerol phosphate synthase subunit HisH n=1 Tax=Thermoflexibacter ruber TaxID=1003 RepID=A0A1I2CKR8_9BACT|nr:imidazole glycerol phosphate synthase subunit HisH [Thermoflexibacter ruber]SFE68854.1 imidazole glycerol phosphate synthase subunit hisH [Thermoflexibacter ruber]
MSNIVIIKYNAGNTQSVAYALERLGVTPLITDIPEEIIKADKVIFPGVGEASTAMNYLKERRLDEVIKNLKQPVLGICVGMQLLCKYSEENDTPCMGIFDLEVKRFVPQGQANHLKVPQIGWNQLHEMQGVLFRGLPSESYVYFVHSYYAELSPYTIAKANYIHDFSAALHKDNFYALQFHTEKSGQVGAKILENFLSQ